MSTKLGTISLTPDEVFALLSAISSHRADPYYDVLFKKLVKHLTSDVYDDGRYGGGQTFHS